MKKIYTFASLYLPICLYKTQPIPNNIVTLENNYHIRKKCLQVYCIKLINYTMNMSTTYANVRFIKGNYSHVRIMPWIY